MGEVVFANVFGTDEFPVCNAGQKSQIEDAFKSATEYMGQPHEESTNCVCDVIIQLLNGTADRDTQVRAAKIVAESVYNQKMGMMRFMEQFLQGESSPSKSVH